MKKHHQLHIASLLIAITTLGAICFAATPGLYGIHWYSSAVSQPGLVEQMTAGKPCWVLENAMTNTSASQIWEMMPWRNENIIKPFQQKSHVPIIRLQPYWGANVPHPDDPYTTELFAKDCKNAANNAKNISRWQVGNEVNIIGENKRWDGVTNTYSGAQWQPTASQYATTYLAVRDAIHEVTPNDATEQTVLLAPVSPGAADGARNLDGYEFLFDTLRAMTPDERNKVDGFGIHAYAPVGAPNNGVNDFMEAVNRQLTIIDIFGLGSRPVFITEWNMHMPTAAAAQNAARFIPAALRTLDRQNITAGALWPQRQPHTVTGTMWFVYPKDSDTITDGWNAWSIEFWKGKTGNYTVSGDPWLAYQAACTYDYQAGASGNIIDLKDTELWCADEFDNTAGAVIDSYAPAPAWHTDCANGGTATYTGTGMLKLAGNTQWASSSIYTRANAFADLRLTAGLKIVNGTPVTQAPEANTEIRFHENDCGTRGYSLTFFSAQSPANTNKIKLREMGTWNTIANCETIVPDGIRTGDEFTIDIIAKDETIAIKICRKNNSIPVAEWHITENRFRMGGIRLMNYCMQEVHYDYIRIGGVNRPDDNPSEVKDWD